MYIYIYKIDIRYIYIYIMGYILMIYNVYPNFREILMGYSNGSHFWDGYFFIYIINIVIYLKIIGMLICLYGY